MVLNYLENIEKQIEFLEFIKDNKNIRSIFFDHWKSIEKINKQIIDNFPSFCLIHSKEINHLKGSSLNKSGSSIQLEK